MKDLTGGEKDMIYKNVPRLLYKYMRWNNYEGRKSYAEEMLVNHYHYLSKPDDFNDMHELKIKYLYSDDKVQNELCEISNAAEADRDRANLGIICYTRRWDNPIMWAHYADNSKGICCEYEGLFDQCKIGTSFADEVHYHGVPQINIDNGRHLSDMLPILLAQMRTLYKAHEWDAEEEIRYVDLKPPKDRYYVYLPECLKSIYCGTSMGEETLNEIVDIVKRTAPWVNVFQVKCKNDSYGFETKPIITGISLCSDIVVEETDECED